MSNSEPKEFSFAKRLIDEGNFVKAFQILSDFEKKQGITGYNIVSCHLLKCDLLIQQGCYKNAAHLAKQTYKESLELGKNLLSIDALNYNAQALLWINNYEKAFNITTQSENLLKSFTPNLSAEYKQREAHIFFIKSSFDFFDLDQRLNFINQSLVLREELGIKREIAESMRTIAHLHAAYKGEFDCALDYLKRALSFAEESKNKYCIAMVLRTLMLTYGMRGNFDQAARKHRKTSDRGRNCTCSPRRPWGSWRAVSDQGNDPRTQEENARVRTGPRAYGLIFSDLPSSASIWRSTQYTKT